MRQLFDPTLLAAAHRLYREAAVYQQGRTGADPVWMLDSGDAKAAGEPFSYGRFVMALAVVRVWLTDRFDRAEHQAACCTAQLLDHRPPAADWRVGDRRLVWILEATGLDPLRDRLRAAGQRLRQSVRFLVPERLNPAPQAPATDGEPTCVIVMPFGLAGTDSTCRRTLR